jgi:hypothetical protein
VKKNPCRREHPAIIKPSKIIIRAMGIPCAAPQQNPACRSLKIEGNIHCADGSVG